MYNKTKLLELTKRLADGFTQLPNSMYGLSNNALQVRDLQRTASELVHDVQSDAKRQALSAKAHVLEGQLQTATVMGLIGDHDYQAYLGMIDDIYASLDQEN